MGGLRATIPGRALTVVPDRERSPSPQHASQPLR